MSQGFRDFGHISFDRTPVDGYASGRYHTPNQYPQRQPEVTLPLGRTAIRTIDANVELPNLDALDFSALQPMEVTAAPHSDLSAPHLAQAIPDVLDRRNTRSTRSTRKTYPSPFIRPVGHKILAVKDSPDEVLAGLDFKTPDLPELEITIPKLGNPELPTEKKREEIKGLLRDSRIGIIKGDTGSGKSTQTPQFALELLMELERESKVDGELPGIIYLSQPRRAAAYGVAERIQAELINAMGEEKAAGLVGWHTAESKNISPNTRIIVLTDGIETARAFNSDHSNRKVIHIIDEVHEWNDNIELAEALTPRVLANNPNASVFFMSATMDAPGMAKHLTKITGLKPPIVEVPGRTFGIEKREAAESTTLKEALKLAEERPEQGGLVIVPGKVEIEDTIKGLYNQMSPEVRKNTLILPFHAKLSKAQQDRIHAQTNLRLIIVATNAVETSLTLPTVDWIVDSGYERQIDIDGEGVEGLHLHVISQANCDQRAGRCGRVRPGHYVLTRYDEKTPFVPYAERPKYALPEIMRTSTSVERLVLRAAGIGVDFAELDLLHPVTDVVIARAKDSLFAMGALDEKGVITRRGVEMNNLPIRASSARMVMEAKTRFDAQTTAYMVAIAAAREVGGLQFFARHAGKAWKKHTQEKSSDMLVQLDLFLAVLEMYRNKKSEADFDLLIAEDDLDVQNVRRALQHFGKLIERTRVYLPDEELKPPSQDQRGDLLECIYSGMLVKGKVHKYNGKGTYVEVGKSEDTKITRKLSTRSTVWPSRIRAAQLVGDERIIEKYVQRQIQPVDIIEMATVLDEDRFSNVLDLHSLATWRTTGIAWSDGQPVELQQREWLGVAMNDQRKVPAEPSKELRRAVIEYSLEHPGPVQKALRQVKTQSEALQHFTKQRVALTNEMLQGWINAATPANITDPSQVDDYLRRYLVALGKLPEEASHNPRLEHFVSPQWQSKIMQAAVRTAEAEGVTFNIWAYRNGSPWVRLYDPAAVLRLTEPVRIPDGREVLFAYKKKRYTLATLQAKLREDETNAQAA